MQQREFAMRENPSRFFNERKPDIQIDTIVIHTMHCVEPECGAKFDPGANKKVLDKYEVSAHYILDRRGGVTRLVTEENRAWHAGVSKLPFEDDSREGANDFSIGIECLATDDSGLTDSQYRSLAKLTAGIIGRHPIKYVLGHSDIAPGRKTDPWNFDWRRFEEGVRERVPGSRVRFLER